MCSKHDLMTSTLKHSDWRDGLKLALVQEPEGQRMALTKALGVFVIFLLCVFAYALYTAITVAF